jgi:hypothetical protein
MTMQNTSRLDDDQRTSQEIVFPATRILMGDLMDQSLDKLRTIHQALCPDSKGYLGDTELLSIWATLSLAIQELEPVRNRLQGAEAAPRPLRAPAADDAEQAHSVTWTDLDDVLTIISDTQARVRCVNMAATSLGGSLADPIMAVSMDAIDKLDEAALHLDTLMSKAEKRRPDIAA